MRASRIYAGVFLLLATVFVGCDVPEREVAGNVTLDEQPLKAGEIVFEAADGKTAPVAAPISDGKFAALVPIGAKKVRIGAKKVRINASGPSDKIDPVLKKPFVVSIIPEQYNSKTNLTADVAVDKPNNLTFALKSKP